MYRIIYYILKGRLSVHIVIDNTGRRSQTRAKGLGMTTDSEQGLAKMKKEARDYMPHSKDRWKTQPEFIGGGDGHAQSMGLGGGASHSLYKYLLMFFVLSGPTALQVPQQKRLSMLDVADIHTSNSNRQPHNSSTAA